MDNTQHFITFGQTQWGQLGGKVLTFADMDSTYLANVYFHLLLRKDRGFGKGADLYLAEAIQAYSNDRFGFLDIYRPYSSTEKDAVRAGRYSGVTVDADAYGTIRFDGRAIGYIHWERYDKDQEEEDRAIDDITAGVH